MNVEKEAKLFVEKLKKVHENKAYMLKKCLNGENWDFYETFPEFAYKMSVKNDQVFTYKIIANLFYAKPRHSEKDVKIGEGFKKFFNDSKNNSFKKRFLILLNTNSREEIYKKRILFKMIKLISKKEIPINYENLFKDIGYWGKKTKEKWAYDFFSI